MMPRFTTKGQIVQLGIALAALIFSGIKVWPDMQKTNLLSLGAIIFYLLASLVVFMIVMLIRQASRKPPDPSSSLPASSGIGATSSLAATPQNPPQFDQAITAIQPLAKKPANSARISGAFYKVEIIRYGVIKETRTHGQDWMLCSFRLRLSLSVHGAPSIEIKDIRLRTHRNKPPCRSLPSMASPQVTVLEEQHLGQHFEAYPQVEFHYFGANELPESLDLIVIDEFEREHIICLRDSDSLPKLPIEEP